MYANLRLRHPVGKLSKASSVQETEEFPDQIAGWRNQYIHEPIETRSMTPESALPGSLPDMPATARLPERGAFTNVSSTTRKLV